MTSDSAPAVPMAPSELVAFINQTLEYAYSSVLLTGEVASFKVNQGKWVFFDIKDEETSVPCFMTLYQLKMPIEDGMKVVVRGVPKITKWGKFSFTVTAIKPVGEGSIKKSFEILKKKLDAEGLFDPAKKRGIPEDLTRLGIISSTQAAGYADFIKIMNARWGGMKVSVAHTQVQGLDAPSQIVRALKYFNEHGDVQMIAIIRGGGSADDLSCFNDEELVRAIAASKIPVITGIGHEVDESLADLAADVRASTPSNAAEMLTHDKVAEVARVKGVMAKAGQVVKRQILQAREENIRKINSVAEKMLEGCRRLEDEILKKQEEMLKKIRSEYDLLERSLIQKIKMIEMLNPEKVLSQGYAIIAGKISPGSVVNITTHKNEIKAEIKEIYERK